jgi:hypothetical protein
MWPILKFRSGANYGSPARQVLRLSSVRSSFPSAIVTVVLSLAHRAAMRHAAMLMAKPVRSSTLFCCRPVDFCRKWVASTRHSRGPGFPVRYRTRFPVAPLPHHHQAHSSNRQLSLECPSIGQGMPCGSLSVPISTSAEPMAMAGRHDDSSADRAWRGLPRQPRGSAGMGPSCPPHPSASEKAAFAAGGEEATHYFVFRAVLICNCAFLRSGKAPWHGLCTASPGSIFPHIVQHWPAGVLRHLAFPGFAMAGKSGLEGESQSIRMERLIGGSGLSDSECRSREATEIGSPTAWYIHSAAIWAALPLHLPPKRPRQMPPMAGDGSHHGCTAVAAARARWPAPVTSRSPLGCPSISHCPAYGALAIASMAMDSSRTRAQACAHTWETLCHRQNA